jgi:hypothetical protein
MSENGNKAWLMRTQSKTEKVKYERKQFGKIKNQSSFPTNTVSPKK